VSVALPVGPASAPDAARARSGSGVAAREWWAVLLGVLAIKLVLLGLDPDPRFFLGDSAAYLRSALEWWVPRDRSFTYGALIWLTAVLPRSLHGLVLAQTVAGVASALLVFAIARVQLGVRALPAAAAALLVAVEPAQLFYERMVMAEAFGGLVWLCFLAACLQYARDGRGRWLALAVGAGIAGASLRQNAIIVSILLPVLLPFVRRGLAGPGARPAWRTTLVHALVVVLATTAVHSAYRHLVGRLTGAPPGYIGVAGVFELGFVAPLLRPEHFAGTGCAPDLLSRVKFDLADPNLREAQLWSPEGLWDVMQRACPSPEAAAKTAADRALAASPLGLFPMAAATLAEHFDDAAARWRMDSDLGRYPLYPWFAESLKRNFDLDAEDFPYRHTATSRWFEAGRWWYTWTYLAMPLLALAIGWRAVRRRDAAALAFALAAGLLAVCQALFTHTLCYRYLYAFPVLASLAAATLASPRARR
jgi:hypothetical protein